jgi:hypothetical protein
LLNESKSYNSFVKLVVATDENSIDPLGDLLDIHTEAYDLEKAMRKSDAFEKFKRLANQLTLNYAEDDLKDLWDEFQGSEGFLF